jgi:hypothetical protein
MKFSSLNFEKNIYPKKVMINKCVCILVITAIIDKLSGHVAQPTGLYRFISTNVYRFKTNSNYRTTVNHQKVGG